VIKDELAKILETRLKSGFSEDQLAAFRRDVDKAYEDGNSEWANKTLPDLLGTRGAQDFLRNVSEELRPA
jgi:hypothetical protein